MLQFRVSRPRQSKPSIRTVAGLWPNFTRIHPPCDGDNGLSLSFPNCESWITGFDALLGGDPKKNGGDEAIGVPDFSAP